MCGTVLKAINWQCKNGDCPGRLTNGNDEELNFRNAHADSHEPNQDQCELQCVLVML